jgi:hypothetical protein
MQTITTKLGESRARIVQQGSQFVQQTSGAATAFIGKTRKARERFTTDTRKAGELLSMEAVRASKAFAAGLNAEAQMWLGTLELDGRLPAIPANVSDIKIPSPYAVERDILARVEKVLALATKRIHVRVKDLDSLVSAQLPASTTPAAAKSKNGAAAPKGAPISGYDDMSAKDVVTRLERMTDDKATAVLAYETANKKRATVLRAAEQRLAADA